MKMTIANCKKQISMGQKVIYSEKVIDENIFCKIKSIDKLGYVWEYTFYKDSTYCFDLLINSGYHSSIYRMR